ncbi:hypothetical protein CHS0354_031283 [Potamilus streckersoni]|uniref:Uncharacterized protein n=1 Tax=Potamilus streckersoni TaxID=2493646 RepID=A0AAE0TCD6_9BIVA|nr:hypothetical protein CHS0354_031283 [Potamilus streckersoni]
MLLALLTVLLQSQRARMYTEITSRKEALFTRWPDQLSWLAAREACDSMSSVILPGMRDTSVLRLLHVGEFAWIDGKQYSFCQAKKTDVNETKEKCKYVTTRREDTRENLTYICHSDGEYITKDEMVPYADAIKQCIMSKTSLLVVKNFALPMVVPLNRTNWIGNYSDSSINNSLSPDQTVTEICIGIMKLDSDKYEFGTTSCDENHTVLCDASGFDTALTLTTRDEMMPRRSDMKAVKHSNHRKEDSFIFVLSGSTSGVLLVVIALIVIVLYRKWKLNQNLLYLSESRQRSCAVQRIYTQEDSHKPSVKVLAVPTALHNPVPDMRRQDRGMLPGNDFIGLDEESERKLLPCNSVKAKCSTQGESNNSGDIKADLIYHKNESPLTRSQNPIDDKNSSDSCHIQGYALLAKQAALCGKIISSGSQKCLFSAQEGYTIPKYQTMTGEEREQINAVYTDDENEYENYRKVDMPTEYQVTILDSN